MPVDEPIALKEVQLRLGVPRHVLIHLCEKGVIEPDFADATGRGKRREFSQRNLFEFEVALALRRFDLPVSTMGLFVRLLRRFGRTVGKALRGHVIPDAPIETNIQFALGYYDGEFLVLCVSGGGPRKPLIPSEELGSPSRVPDKPPRVLN
jgi:DNA-binding transcriptional MerR regulator